MKRSTFGMAVVGIVAWALSGSLLLGGAPVQEIYVKQDVAGDEKLIYVTGSRVPQTVRVRHTRMDTAWPVTIIRQHDIDASGRGSMRDVFVTEPSAVVVGD